MTDILPIPPEQEMPTDRLARQERLYKQAASDERHRRRAIRLAMVASLTAVVLVVAAGLTYRYLPRQTHPIESSYAFDVTNPAYVAGYADNVFLGHVEHVAATQADRQRTLYRITVEHVYKGSLGRSVVVGQLGYRSLLDNYVPGDQPILQKGSGYLLATTNADNGQQTGIAGPEAVVEVTAANRGTLDRKWTHAIQDQRYPPGIPKR